MANLITWVWRAWPFLIVVGLAVFHYSFVYYGLVKTSQVNEEVALLAQIIGGFIVLYSIDSNAGLFQEKNLIQMLVSWLKQFPLLPKKSITLQANMALAEACPDTAAIRTYAHPKTLEEKVDHLMQEVEWIKEDMNKYHMEVKQQIDNTRSQLQKQIQQTSVELVAVNQKIKSMAFEGIMVQVFGVNLLVYGAVSGYFA